MRITKAQARLYQIVKQDVIQHAIFGAVVVAFVFCFVAIHSWYQGKVALLKNLVYHREAMWFVFKEAFLYTLLMGIPVYFNLFFIYKGRIQSYVEKRLFSEAQQKGWGFYIFLFFSLLTATVFALIYAPVIQHHFELINQRWYEVVFVILVLILCTTGVSFTKESIESNRALERMERLEAIRKQKQVEQELQYIKKQIRPHFLFNTLANLQILARRKSDQLPHLIGELSQLLRHLVYRTNERMVPLEDELDFIESFINLQRIQLGKDTELSFCTKGETKAQHQIAPMILLLLVENCFKHYNRNQFGKKFIRVRFEIVDDQLKAELSNSYKKHARNEDNFKDQSYQGVGLNSVVENLKLLYPTRHRLEFSEKDGVFSVYLKLPLL